MYSTVIDTLLFMFKFSVSMHKNRQIETNSYIILQNVVYNTLIMFKCSMNKFLLLNDSFKCLELFLIDVFFL